MTGDAQDYDISTIRKLLEAAFTAEDLQTFCYDRPAFRPVVNQFGRGHGLADMVQEVIVFCETRLLFDELLAEVSQWNPGQYERFEADLGPALGPAIGTAPLVDLAEEMARRFDLADLQLLSDSLDVSFEDLPGPPRKTHRAFNLANELHRSNRLPDLIAELEEKRPFVDWRRGLEMHLAPPDSAPEAGPASAGP